MGNPYEPERSGFAFWIFMFSFAVNAATIVSGSVAERSQVNQFFHDLKWPSVLDWRLYNLHDLYNGLYLPRSRALVLDRNWMATKSEDWKFLPPRLLLKRDFLLRPESTSPIYWLRWFGRCPLHRWCRRVDWSVVYGSERRPFWKGKASIIIFWIFWFLGKRRTVLRP